MRSTRPLLATAAALLIAPPIASQQSIDGRWEGAILVLGTELGFGVDFVTADTTLTATMDIPDQNAFNLPLLSVSFADPTVHFELLGGPGLAVFDGTVEGDSIGGAFTQAGINGTFWLKPPVEAAGTEAESVPYTREEVRFTNGDITLAGTLTIPEGSGPHPAVVLITGSGPQNRDEEVFGFDPFLKIADHLTREGVAVLRYDDRGVGGSSGSVFAATAQDFARDALAAVDLLARRADIDPTMIGLVGHSEGGIVAPIAAAQSSEVAFIVLLASTAVTGEEILLAQAQLIMPAGGASAEQLEEQRAVQEAIFSAVRTGEGWDDARAHIDRQIRNAIERAPPAQRAAITDIDAFVANQMEQQLILTRTQWFRFFLDYNPVTDLRRVQVPVLAVFGETDLQVPYKLNWPPMEEALREAGNPDVTMKVLPKANHLFLASETGSPAEYASLEKEFVPGLLDLLTTWIKEREARE
jgi:pimeloyl-ACP methyl ester carboxylesterase